MAILTGLWNRLSSCPLWVCLSLFLLRGVARPGHRLGSISQCRRDLCQGLVVHLCLRGLTWRVGMRLSQVARSLLVAMSPQVLLTLGGKGSVGVSTSYVSWPSASLISSPAVFQVGILFKFFDHWRSITSNRLVLNIVWCHHLELWSHLHLFHNFWQFNFKVGTTHHSIIEKEVDDLLAEGVIEPSSGGAGFYSSVSVVPKHTGGLQAILNLKHLIVICLYLLLRCQLSDMSGSLFSVVIMLSPLIYRMLFYILLLLSIIISSYDFFGTMCLISGRFCLLGWPQLPGFSLP